MWMASCLRANVRRSLRFCQKVRFGREQCPMLDGRSGYSFRRRRVVLWPQVSSTTLSRQPGELKALWGKTIRLSDRPIFAKEEQEVSDLLESSDFKQVWSVYQAMRFQDERLDDVINHSASWAVKKKRSENLAGEKKSLEEKLNESLLFANIPRKMSRNPLLNR